MTFIYLGSVMTAPKYGKYRIIGCTIEIVEKKYTRFQYPNLKYHKLGANGLFAYW